MTFELDDLGENIKKIRESRPSRIKPERAMYQKELAEKAGIPASSLCNIEKGKYHNPTWEILNKIAKGLECDISDFFSRSEESMSAPQIALTEMIEMIVREKLEGILRERKF